MADSETVLGCELNAYSTHTFARSHNDDRKSLFYKGLQAAAVAELADALDLGSSGVTRGGSSPLSRSGMDWCSVGSMDVW